MPTATDTVHRTYMLVTAAGLVTLPPTGALYQPDAAPVFPDQPAWTASMARTRWKPQTRLGSSAGTPLPLVCCCAAERPSCGAPNRPAGDVPARRPGTRGYP